MHRSRSACAASMLEWSCQWTAISVRLTSRSEKGFALLCCQRESTALGTATRLPADAAQETPTSDRALSSPVPRNHAPASPPAYSCSAWPAVAGLGPDDDAANDDETQLHYSDEST